MMTTLQKAHHDALKTILAHIVNLAQADAAPETPQAEAAASAQAQADAVAASAALADLTNFEDRYDPATGELLQEGRKDEAIKAGKPAKA